MKTAIVTGSCGLIGAAVCKRLLKEGYKVLGIDNNMRAYFFGHSASTEWARASLQNLSTNYCHLSVDIRNKKELESIFSNYNSDINLILHCAAQPSHDWAANEPLTDFEVNAVATIYLLELTRSYCSDATFIFCSTNKVYGDRPNQLPLIEHETRWEIDPKHPYYERGIDEDMSIDQSTHSVFGASKVAADIMVQEYGRYFGLKTAVFRGGCLTGPGHSGAQLHGFLAFLMKCAIEEIPYSIFGYRGKQVRDNIHCDDLVSAFLEFHNNPRHGEVYNIGGGRKSNCSMLEAISICEQLTGKQLIYSYTQQNRLGDHIWWISDYSKFSSHYPKWEAKHDILSILTDIRNELIHRITKRQHLESSINHTQIE
jgi:CDP-paratose 2-epimerase